MRPRRAFSPHLRADASPSSAGHPAGRTIDGDDIALRARQQFSRAFLSPMAETMVKSVCQLVTIDREHGWAEREEQRSRAALYVAVFEAVSVLDR